jgi:hypothetical protein
MIHQENVWSWASWGNAKDAVNPEITTLVKMMAALRT